MPKQVMLQAKQSFNTIGADCKRRLKWMVVGGQSGFRINNNIIISLFFCLSNGLQGWNAIRVPHFVSLCFVVSSFFKIYLFFVLKFLQWLRCGNTAESLQFFLTVYKYFSILNSFFQNFPCSRKTANVDENMILSPPPSTNFTTSILLSPRPLPPVQ